MEEAVAFELLIEGEHSTLGLGLDVSNSTTATEEDLGGRGGRRNGSFWGRAKEAGAQAAIVASSAATSMVVGTGVVNGRTFGDLDGHCGLFGCFVEWVQDGIDG